MFSPSLYSMACGEGSSPLNNATMYWQRKYNEKNIVFVSERLEFFRNGSGTSFVIEGLPKASCFCATATNQMMTLTTNRSRNKLVVPREIGVHIVSLPSGSPTRFPPRTRQRSLLPSVRSLAACSSAEIALINLFLERHFGAIFRSIILVTRLPVKRSVAVFSCCGLPAALRPA